MGTVVVLLLCVLVLRAMAPPPSRRPVSGSTIDVLQGWAEDVVAGARALIRLDAARRARLDRPPWG